MCTCDIYTEALLLVFAVVVVVVVVVRVVRVVVQGGPQVYISAIFQA